MLRWPTREGEQKSRRSSLLQHMWPVPSSSVAATSLDSSSISPDSFISKEGRKIRVGDCALFKAPQDSPPFIGIIRRLILGKEDSLSVRVNWLYRPADVKLGKGVLLEAAPNEVFYSFHKDEIPAVSLLHPCKVVFIRKGVELPSEVSAFVCRRVYDIENKCLWWLTDQDYIKERQEEVDQLLDKSQLEMHGAVQSGGRSPKYLNGAAGTQQSKPGSDSVQNSSSSFHSHVKGKKRERGDQGSEPVKRERSLKAEDADSFRFRPEQLLKSEIAKITDKGGLVDFEGVEKLVQLMHPEGSDKKIDLASRIMLVDVIAVTDRFDCLEQFVLLKGLPVLDEWLKEVHKAKIGDGSSPKESDKSIDEFLLALLRALDKLPVNLQALQTCNVGKSVNHLRTHKNYEIQKKARTLVDAWKKRVQAEMNIIDAKSGSFRGGSWPTKSVVSEVSHVGSRPIGSSEAGVKCSGIQSSASKTAPLKLGSVEIAKYSTPSNDSGKLPASVTTSGGPSTMDPISTTLVGRDISDVQVTTIKEGKSSNSSQSQNNSQSCLSDHANTGTSSFNEDVRSSTALSVNKISSGVSRSRKLSNCLHGSGALLVQKETSSGKITSLLGNMASEKVSPTRTTSERGPDVPLVDNGNSHRLIVRLPNTGRSPARSSSGGSPEDPTSTFSKVSPSTKSDKLDHHDRKVKVKSDVQRATRASNTSMVVLSQHKDGMAGSEEVNTFSSSPVCDRLRKDGEDGEKLMEASKDACLSSRITPKPGKSYEASFSPMNALIESVKFSEANACTSVGDDIGMNLLASVAAGEISRTPLGSPGGKSAASEDPFSGNNVKSRQSDEDSSQSENQPHNGEHGGAMADQGNSVDVLSGFLHHPMPETGESAAQVNASSADLPQNDGPVFMSDGKACNLSYDSSVAVSSVDATKAVDVEGEGADQIHEQRKSVASRSINTSTSNSEMKSRSPLPDEEGNIQNSTENPTGNSAVMAPEPTSSSSKIEKEVNEEPPHFSSSEIQGDDKNVEHKQSGSCNLAEQKALHKIGERNEGIEPPPGFCNVLSIELKAENADDIKTNTVQSKKENLEVGSSTVDHAGECAEDDSDRKEVLGHSPAGSGSHDESPAIPVQDTECKVDGVEAPGAEEPAPLGNPMFLSAAGSDSDVKLDFDLNEGFPIDDGLQGELVKCSAPGNLSSVHFPCPQPISTSAMSGSFHASITVAAAAKGPVVPPEHPLRSKGELGWKGSAATSAFRPAEPRKVLEMPLNTANVPLIENSINKQGRPLLDFDLNVPDQRVFEDLASQCSGHVTCLESRSHDRSGGGLDFDLNRVDESSDIGQSLVSTSCKLETLPLRGWSTLSERFSNPESNATRGFDLNDGPDLDDVVADVASHTKSSMPFLSTVPAIRMNNSELQNFQSWLPSNSYSTFAFTSMLPGRGEHSYPMVPATAPQRILGPSPGSMPMPSLPSFNPEIYRGPVLSSSPAPGFPPPTAFHYPGLPFDTNFPFSSNSYTACSPAYVVDSSTSGPLSFPNNSSQLVGPSGMLSTPYARPYVMSLPGGTSNGGPESRKFGSQGLDLNAGPGGTDVEQRDERLPSALRQLPVTGSQALADERLRFYQMAGGGSKRKEPDGGWDGDRISYYKQSSWK